MYFDLETKKLNYFNVNFYQIVKDVSSRKIGCERVLYPV
jgi:hypothetical protein